MNSDQKKALQKSLRELSAADHLRRDMKKWEKTLETNDEQKVRVLKRMLLLLGSCDLQISEDGKSFIDASENKLPVAVYLAGHLGRVYMSLPEGQGEEVLKWIAGGEEGRKQGTVYPRFAATHAGAVGSDKAVVEKKLSPPKAFFGGLYSAVAGLSGASRNHYGMDVALGDRNTGYSSSYPSDGEAAKIKDDGTGGHLYFNFNKGRNGDSLGFGFEGTAPSKSGFLGAHSFFGAADDFTPFEGEKFAVKLTAEYLDEYLDEFFLKEEKPKPKQSPLFFSRKRSETAPANETNSKKPALTDDQKEAKRKLAGHANYSIFKPFSGNKKLSAAEITRCCRFLGIKLTNNNTQILTPFAKRLSDSGVSLPCNYNGARLKIDDNKISAILSTDAEAIDALPLEMIYCLPSNSVEKFKAQVENAKKIDKDKFNPLSKPIELESINLDTKQEEEKESDSLTPVKSNLFVRKSDPSQLNKQLQQEEEKEELSTPKKSQNSPSKSSNLREADLKFWYNGYRIPSPKDSDTDKVGTQEVALDAFKNKIKSQRNQVIEMVFEDPILIPSEKFDNETLDKKTKSLVENFFSPEVAQLIKDRGHEVKSIKIAGYDFDKSVTVVNKPIKTSKDTPAIESLMKFVRSFPEIEAVELSDCNVKAEEGAEMDKIFDTLDASTLPQPFTRNLALKVSTVYTDENGINKDADHLPAQTVDEFSKIGAHLEATPIQEKSFRYCETEKKITQRVAITTLQTSLLPEKARLHSLTFENSDAENRSLETNSLVENLFTNGKEGERVARDLQYLTISGYDFSSPKNATALYDFLDLAPNLKEVTLTNNKLEQPKIEKISLNLKKRGVKLSLESQPSIKSSEPGRNNTPRTSLAPKKDLTDKALLGNSPTNSLAL